MSSDNDGFVTLDANSDGRQGAHNVVEFAQVGDLYILGPSVGILKTIGKDIFVLCMPLCIHRPLSHKLSVRDIQAMLRHALTVPMPHNGKPTSVRVGIHTGSVVRCDMSLLLGIICGFLLCYVNKTLNKDAGRSNQSQYPIFD